MVEPSTSLDETLVALPGQTPASLPVPTDSLSPPPGSGERQVLARRYEILALLGAGGMGTVYRARDRELEETVALKVLRRDLVDAPGILERFRREVKLARRVTHKNVARVFDIGEHEGEKFLTMEFVDGEPLTAVIAREGALSVPRAAAIAAAIAAGLAGAHAAGVVHRDLKPDNVLMAKDGRVVITDFGIARGGVEMGASSTMGALLGTPAYMAPEQVEGLSDIDARADVYAFGVLLFELFTGARAWPGDAPFAVAAARLVAPPPDPRSKRASLPAAAAELTLRCLARSREDRPASMTEIAVALDALAAAPASATTTGVRPAPVAATIATPTPVQSDKTVAVLPFRNGGAPEDDYLAEELTDDLIDALSMTRKLKVRSRGTVARYRGREIDPREVGRELSVQVVVEGSVRRARGSVRVSARLMSVADGFQLWAKRFDRPEQDVLSINDEVARSIAEALTLDCCAAARVAPSDPAALDLYIRARHEYRKFWPDPVKRSVSLFQQAHALAPSDPMILSGLALAQARASFFAGDGEFSVARRLAEDAVAAAPELGEAHLALGSVLFQTGEYVAAVRALRAAVTRSPGFAEAHATLGRLLVEVAAVDEGIRRMESALTLEPEAPNVRQEMGRAFALLGRWEEAFAQFERLRGSDDMYAFWTMRARMALWRREAEVAEQYLRELGDNAGGMKIPQLILELQRGKKLPSTVAKELEDMASPAVGGVRRRAFFLQIRAEIFAALGDRDRALSSMEMALAVGLIDRLWMERCPLFEELRREPRYLAAHAEMARRTDAILLAYRTA